MKKEKLPNQLTILRIFMIPVFVILLYLPKGMTISVDYARLGGLGGIPQMIIHAGVTYNTWLIAAIIFALASITDWLDGFLSRKWKVVSNFGKFADPLADKMLNMTAFALMIHLGLVPAWLVAIIICRELAVTGLRLLLVEQGGTVLAAAMPGKIKTATQMLSIIFLLIGFQLIGNILLYICLFFTVYSGIDYFVKNGQVFRNAD